jgi:hypothetical protein
MRAALVVEWPIRSISSRSPATGFCKHVPGMTQVVKVDQRQASRPKRWKPDPLPEVPVPQRRSLRAREDQPVIVRITLAADVLPDHRHDRSRYDDQASASIRLGRSDAEPAAAKLDQLPSYLDRLRGQVNLAAAQRRAKPWRGPPGARRATPTGTADQAGSSGAQIGVLCRLPHAPVSRSRPPRLGRPAGVAARPAFAEPRPGTPSPGIWRQRGRMGKTRTRHARLAADP